MLIQRPEEGSDSKQLQQDSSAKSGKPQQNPQTKIERAITTSRSAVGSAQQMISEKSGQEEITYSGPATKRRDLSRVVHPVP